MKKFILLSTWLIITNGAVAQQWIFTASDTILSEAGGVYPYICIDKTNTPYIVYFDQNTNGGCAVKKFTGSQWISVGSNLNIGYVGNPSMDFDSSGTPYVAYRDDNTGSKATVKRFDGTNWITLGSAGFTPSGASFESLKIGPDNTPYLAFRDVQYNYSASVMKFNGTNWVYVGTPGFSPQAPASGAGCTSLAIDKNGVLYVAFLDLSNNWQASVMKFDGTDWVYVGAPNISGGSADATSLVIDSQNTPIIAYTNGSAQVKRFDGTNWISVGMPDFTPADSPFLAIDKHDRLSITYKKNDTANAMKFDGSNWIQAGNSDFSPSVVPFSPTIAADTSGNLFVAFADGTERPFPGGSGTYWGACVMKLTNTFAVTGAPWDIKNSSFLNTYPNPTRSLLHICFHSTEEGQGIIKIYNITGQIIYKEEFIGEYNKELNLNDYGKGMYLIEIQASEVIERKKIVLN